MGDFSDSCVCVFYIQTEQIKIIKILNLSWYKYMFPLASNPFWCDIAFSRIAHR